MEKLEELHKIKNGVLRDFIRRALIAQNEPWYKLARIKSGWCMANYHDQWQLTPDHKTPYLPTYWMDRVLDLLEHDATRSVFGFTFDYLTDLDVATFEKIEDRVHDYMRRQSEALKDVKNSAEGKGTLIPPGTQKLKLK